MYGLSTASRRPGRVEPVSPGQPDVFSRIAGAKPHRKPARSAFSLPGNRAQRRPGNPDQGACRPVPDRKPGADAPARGPYAGDEATVFATRPGPGRNDCQTGTD